MLKAARELFSQKGYDGTTTKEIAKKAGVLEPLLFKNFGSKSNLFTAAVIAPFSELVADYVDYWNSRYADSSPEIQIKKFIESFYDLASRNRKLLLIALLQEREGDESSVNIFAQLAHVLHRIEGSQSLSEKYPQVDGAAAVTAVAGMVFGTALLADRIFPPASTDLSIERISDEMGRLVLYGTFGRPKQIS
ncbi:MAG: helix-turn-helix domain-containing protein [Spongiibacteraceae bacterium]